jgi:hypothetical protein
MPRQYEAMRDKFKRGGLSDRAAKTKAAKIYNAAHPATPVTGKHGRKKRGLTSLLKQQHNARRGAKR